MKRFKAWSLLALAMGFCAFPLSSMAQQQSGGFIGGQAGSFLQDLFGYGNNQSTGYPGSSANRAPIYQNSAPDRDYQGNDDDGNDDDPDQSVAAPNGRLGGNYPGGGSSQYGNRNEGQSGYNHRNDAYGNGNPNDSENRGNGQGNGGYHRRHHHHSYRQGGSQDNWNGGPQGHYQNRNNQYDSNQQPDTNDDGSNY